MTAIKNNPVIRNDAGLTSSLNAVSTKSVSVPSSSFTTQVISAAPTAAPDTEEASSPMGPIIGALVAIVVVNIEGRRIGHIIDDEEPMPYPGAVEVYRLR